MQNSGLGAALAKQHFAMMPLVALPCAISATFHSVIGSILAGFWRLRPVRQAAPGDLPVSDSARVLSAKKHSPVA